MKNVTIAEAHRMAAAYRKGKTLKDVGAKFGWHHSTVKYHLVRLGVPLRSRSAVTKGWRKHTTAGGRKNCATCGHWRHLHDFGRDRKLPDGIAHRCLPCRRAAQKARRADPIAGELYREYDRIWHDGQRRMRGAAQRQYPNRVDVSKPTVPVAPLVVALQAWLRSHSGAHPGVKGHNGGGQTELSRRSGVPERRLYGLLNGEYATVTLHTADRLALAIDSHLDLIYVDDAGQVAA